MWVNCGKGSGCGKSMILVSVAMLPRHEVEQVVWTLTCVVTSRLDSTLQ